MKWLSFIIIIFLVVGTYSGKSRKNRSRGSKKPSKGNKGNNWNWNNWPTYGNSKPTFGNNNNNKPSIGENSNVYNCPGAISRNELQSSTVSRAKSDLKANLFSDRFDRFAHSVRLAFHDCVGGCDGCINRNNPDNFGPMLDTLLVIDQIYDDRYIADMSRADFYILVAITGLEESLNFNNVNLTSSFIKPVKFIFKYGRCDCPTSPTTTVDRGFPNGHFDYQEVMDFFRQEFGFSVKESVAIMGGHTLGGASGTQGSGFEGFWKEGATAAARFNNRYYSLLADRSLTWQHVDRSQVTGLGQQRWQWVAGETPQGVPAPFMLNADVSLFKDITPNMVGRSSCQFIACSSSPSAKFVKKFAKNGNSWIKEFVKVWDKMTAKGANNLMNPA